MRRCVCVIAPVSLEEPKVLPHSAKEAPRALSCAKALPASKSIRDDRRPKREKISSQQLEGSFTITSEMLN